MDAIQRTLIKAGRKDLAVKYYHKIKGSLDKPTAVTVINKKLSDLGFKLKVKEADLESDKYKKIGNIKINPKTTGLMAPMFKQIEVDVSVGYVESKEGLIRVSLHYSYKHYRGSNGYNVMFVYWNGKWEQED